MGNCHPGTKNINVRKIGCKPSHLTFVNSPRWTAYEDCVDPDAFQEREVTCYPRNICDACDASSRFPVVRHSSKRKTEWFSRSNVDRVTTRDVACSPRLPKNFPRLKRSVVFRKRTQIKSDAISVSSIRRTVTPDDLVWEKNSTSESSILSYSDSHGSGSPSKCSPVYPLPRRESACYPRRGSQDSDAGSNFSRVYPLPRRESACYPRRRSQDSDAASEAAIQKSEALCYEDDSYADPAFSRWKERRSYDIIWGQDISPSSLISGTSFGSFSGPGTLSDLDSSCSERSELTGPSEPVEPSIIVGSE